MAPVCHLNIENSLIRTSGCVLLHLILYECGPVSDVSESVGLNSQIYTCHPFPHRIFVIALQKHVRVRACFARAPCLSRSRKKNTHYKHFARVFPRHATGSSDSGQSQVLQMPQEASLTCMRAGAGLWCNCSNGEGQRPAQPGRDIKAQMWTQHSGFLAAISVLFEDGGMNPPRTAFCK